MKISNLNERKAISPIIATVLIIAATLIAFAAIGGYMFGLLGTGTATANLQGTNAALTVTGKTGSPATTGLAAVCQAVGAAGPAANYGYVEVKNTGSANAAVNGFVITYGGTQQSATPTGGAACTVTAGGGVWIWMTASGATAPAAGQSYSGYAITSQGVQVTFTGTFS